MKHHVEVPGRPAANARLAMTEGAEPRSGVNTSRNLDIDFGGTLPPPRPAASLARILDDAPRPFATRAGLSDAEDAARGHDLAAPLASWTHFGLGVPFASGAMADFAKVELVDRHFLFRPLGSFQ